MRINASITSVGFNVKVSRRYRTYIARCEGRTGSCRHSRYLAVRRAAAKAFNASGQFTRIVSPNEVTIQGPPDSDIYFVSFTETERA